MSETKLERKKRRGGALTGVKFNDNEKETDKYQKSEKKIKSTKILEKKINHLPTVDNVDDMIEKFDFLFLNEDKISEKKVRSFSKEAFSIKSSNIQNESINVNYNNLIIFLLKFSGLEIDSAPNYGKLIANINENNFADFDLLDDIIASCKVKSGNFKAVKEYSIFESVVIEIYNNYEITCDKDFEILKKFISNFLKLTKNKYRKIRYYSTLILLNIFRLMNEELINSKKLLSQRSKNKKSNLDFFLKNSSNSQSFEENKSTVLEVKIKILDELIQILKEKFLYLKISDVSKNIRLAICDYIIKIGKNHFTELFSDNQLVKFYPFFLIDSNTNIKYKYLQLIYEKLDLIEVEDIDAEDKINNDNDRNSTINTIVNILSVARDSILNICVKEDKLVAKQAVKIIELLSQHNILEIKTVQSLLPHLFNPEPQIRNLISKVVVNYILNFEKSEKIEVSEEMDIEESNPNDAELTKKKLEKKSRQATVENLVEMLEFFFKLTENEEKMIKVLVENFYKYLNIFQNFSLFFELINILLDSSNTKNEEWKILETGLIVLNLSIEKLQKEIENAGENERSLDNIPNNSNIDEDIFKSLIPKNEEFLNLFITNIISQMKKMRINLSTSVNCNIFNHLIKLFSKFKIYRQNLIKFNQNNLTEILIELKNSFFINIRIDQISEIDEKETTFNPTENFFEEYTENILKAIHKLYLINEMDNPNDKTIENIIYSNNISSLSKDFFEIFNKEISSTEFYRTLTLISSEEFSSNHYTTEFSKYVSIEIWSRYYNIITQFNNILIYFQEVFLNENYELIKICNFLQNLIKFCYSSCGNDRKSMYLFFKLSDMSLKLNETIHLLIFNDILNNEADISKVDRYVTFRGKLIANILHVLNVFKYKEINSESQQGSNDNCRIFNNNILKLKTSALNILLDILIYVSSENIENQIIKFLIDDSLIQDVENFLKNNFIKFYLGYNKVMNKIKGSDIDLDEGNENSEKNGYRKKFEEESIFEEELSVKTYCFKSICEKFSRLLLLNLSIFKSTSLSCIYFETFYLIKLPAVIDNLNQYVYESLMEKEVQHFIKNNNSNIQYSNLNVMIFYLTKISMRVFTNKTRLLYIDHNVDEFNFSNDEKIEMINRFINYYIKTFKKMKLKHNRDNIDITNKDKTFYENFIINSINFALESRKENVVNRFENGKEVQVKEISIENIKFFLVIKFFLKSSIFLSESDFKQILMIFLKLSKNVELLDNVDRSDIKLLEKFKNLLLSKAKLFISNEMESQMAIDEGIKGKKIEFDDLNYGDDEERNELKNNITTSQNNIQYTDNEDDINEQEKDKVSIENKKLIKKIKRKKKTEITGKKRKFNELPKMDITKEEKLTKFFKDENKKRIKKR